MSREPNSQYNVAAPGSLPVRIAHIQRQRIFSIFTDVCEVANETTVMDVGATSDRTYIHSNYLEAWLPVKSRITAVGLDDATFLEQIYPGLTFVQANGLNLPFEQKAFDVVHSSAVLEHVGSFDNQVQFISECARVAKYSLFLTTPNRFFPIEFHTLFPFVHWLPKVWFRRIMRATGHYFFSKEENLNLMSKSEIQRAAELALRGTDFEFRIFAVNLLGLSSNICLHGWRKPSDCGSK